MADDSGAEGTPDSRDGRASLTERVLAGCRALGRVRVVLRNQIGLAEGFADLGDLRVSDDGWAHLVCEAFHAHLTTGSLGAVAFRESVPNAPHGQSRAVWLYGRRGGCPLVLFVLDQANGLEARAQCEAFDRLCCEFGRFSFLVSEQEMPGHAPCSKAPAEAGTPRSARWH